MKLCPRICLTLFVLSPIAALSEDADEGTELEQIVVTATRSAAFIRDQPLRVEVLPAEEIEENLTVRPGNLSSLLNELPGVRLQASVPSLGGAGLQLRGMPTRHTLVLSDGLPLLGAEPDAFGLLQTPPLDLERVEVVKGAMSALYGGSALGGVLNLVSRSASAEPAVLANVTSRGGRDLLGFFTAAGTSPWSGTVTGGAHYQSREDVDGDGWADLAGYRRWTLRPRLWWNGGAGQSLFLTAGIVDEARDGGTLPGRRLPDGTPFFDALDTQRLDFGAVTRWPLDDGYALSGRISVTSNHAVRTFGASRTPSTRTTAFGETAWSGRGNRHSWVLGLAFEHAELRAAAAPGTGYTYDVPAIFAQDEFSPVPWLALSGSVRFDAHSDYGNFLSPRVSALLRPAASPWSLRASIGGGFAAPTPLVDEIEATGLGALLPLRGLRAERARTASLDAKWSEDGWDLNASVFTGEIRDPLGVQSAPGNRLQLINAAGSRRASGAEALIGYVAGPLHAIASWSYLEVTEVETPGLRQDAPLAPRQAFELAAILENERHGRVGVEIGYTGRQTIANDPYRSVSRGYFELNALGELRLGAVAIFLNAINLTDVRQTNYDPLVRTSPGPGGNPITDVWAPLEGRTFNLGIRAEF